MKIYEKGRLQFVEVHDSRNASLIGKYQSLIGQALEKGDPSILKRLRRRRFKDWRGRTHILETRFNKIYELKMREAKPEVYEIYQVI